MKKHLKILQATFSLFGWHDRIFWQAGDDTSIDDGRSRKYLTQEPNLNLFNYCYYANKSKPQLKSDTQTFVKQLAEIIPSLEIEGYIGTPPLELEAHVKEDFIHYLQSSPTYNNGNKRGLAISMTNIDFYNIVIPIMRYLNNYTTNQIFLHLRLGIDDIILEEDPSKVYITKDISLSPIKYLKAALKFVKNSESNTNNKFNQVSRNPIQSLAKSTNIPQNISECIVSFVSDLPDSDTRLLNNALSKNEIKLENYKSKEDRKYLDRYLG